MSNQHPLSFAELQKALEAQHPHFVGQVLAQLWPLHPSQDLPESVEQTSPASPELSAQAREALLERLLALASSEPAPSPASAPTQDSDDDEDFEDDDEDFEDDDDDEDDEDDDDEQADEDEDEADDLSAVGAAAEEPGASVQPSTVQTLQQLKQALAPERLARLSSAEQKSARLEAWQRLERSPLAPSRLKFGKLLLELDAQNTPWAREVLLELVARVPFRLGIWQGLKTLFKRAEARHDLELFICFAHRVDIQPLKDISVEVGWGTLLYLKRRVWRTFRQLGQTLPALFVVYACALLSRYRDGDPLKQAFVFHQLLARTRMKKRGVRSRMPSAPFKREERAFPDAWKGAVEPLLTLAERAQHPRVLEFVFQQLVAEEPEALRSLPPERMRRLLVPHREQAHQVLIPLLEKFEQYAPGQLPKRGLHDTVLGLLESPSSVARAFALRYARTCAGEVPVPLLLRLVQRDQELNIVLFALAQLEKTAPLDIGLAGVVTLLRVYRGREVGAAKLLAGFSPRDMTLEAFRQLFLSEEAVKTHLEQLYKAHQQSYPVTLLLQLLDEPLSWSQQKTVNRALEGYSGAEIGGTWLLSALQDTRRVTLASQWLRSGKFKAAELDLEALKGLIELPEAQDAILSFLGEPKNVSVERLGIPWLVSLWSHPTPALHTFAGRMLLEHVSPQALGAALVPGGNAEAALDTLLEQLRQKRLAEWHRTGLSRYLLAHHPVVGPSLSADENLGVKPALARGLWTLARLRPLLTDERAELRQLALRIVKVELVRWGEPSLLLELAQSRHRELRRYAATVLLAMGQGNADPAEVPPVEWLQPGPIFLLAEAPQKELREVAMTLIRRHYERLGGAQKLVWLLETPEREVRLFVVRLVWEKHHRHARPASGVLTSGSVEKGEPVSVSALRGLVQTVLFGLPPGRLEQREGGPGLSAERALPARVAKQRLLDVVLTLSLEDVTFARQMRPVLEAFAASSLKGEWQASVSALAQLQRVHGERWA